MNLIQMIEEINRICQKSLGMTYYYNHWDVSSYKAGTCLFSLHIKDADLEKAIYNALNVARECKRSKRMGKERTKQTGCDDSIGREG